MEPRTITVSLNMNSVSQPRKGKTIQFSLMVKSQTLELTRSGLKSQLCYLLLRDVTTIKDYKGLLILYTSVPSSANTRPNKSVEKVK